MSEEIRWEKVDIKDRRRIGEPFATIAKGRISFNSSACSLLDMKKYKYAEVIKGLISQKLCQVKVRFIKDSTLSSFAIVSHKSEDGTINLATINSAPLYKELFGEYGLNKTCKYSVTLEDKNTLIIDLNKEF